MAGSTPEPAAPAEPASVDDAPPADASFEKPKSDDKPFDDEPFDAGVDADEESDPKKFIEQLTGKLGQSLRKYTEEQGQPDFELEKFSINSLLSATHTSEMDAEDQKDIINKVKEAGQGDEDVAPESDKASDETPSEEPAPESEPSDEEGLAEFRVYENMDNLFVNPKKNNMFQDGSNDILDESDRCTKIAKSKYDVWPSAYASGAVVKCRKGKIWKNLKEEDLKELGDYKSMTDEQLDEKWSQKYKKSIDCDNPKGFSQKAHCQGRKKHDESVEEAAKKTDFSKEKESGLHGWFSRRGGEGSKGWVDCNTCRDGKCKPCGREDGESRAKYPSCRPTPSACKTKGKGDSWGKKSTNESEYNVYENMNFDFVKSAIESASGDKVQKREEDDYGRPLYWSLTNDNIHYFIGNKDGEEVIVLYNAETGERYPIGNLKHYDTSDELNENMGETNNYMFWSNLKTIVHATGELMKMDCNRVDSILSDGHGWALDHMATANDDIEEVYHFLEGQINYEGADAEPMTEHEHESNNYMFWQNLKTMHHGAKEMLEMDSSRIDAILSDGHGWALDHVATSADDVEDVYHFIETEVDSYDGETQGGYSDEYGSVQNVTMNEAEYKGRTVKLGKPMKGDVKKFKVFVKNKSGKVVKVNFGDPNMEIKRDNPKRRKSFRARHKCSQAKDRTTPKYWSCRMWSRKPVSKMVENLSESKTVENLSDSKKSSIFDKNYLKMKVYESLNQNDTMNQPVTEPVVKPAPTKPAEQPVKQPSRKDKPFLPLPEVTPDPKAIKK